jgi:uncharacterized heparinase superfamily protein
MPAATNAPGALGKLLGAATDEWRATPFYRMMLRGADPDRIMQWGKDPRVGDGDHGAEIVAGTWRIASERLNGNNLFPWSAPPPSPHFSARLHSFSWLRDVAALGPTARECIAMQILSWVSGFGEWHPQAWAPELVAERLFAWLCHGKPAFEGGDPVMRPALMRSFGRQARHLHLAAGDLREPNARIKAGAVLTMVGCAGVPESERFLDLGLAMLGEACAAQFSPDGAHLSRAPENLCEALCDMIAADDALVRHAIETPAPVRETMVRMAGMLRFLRMGDGGLACFQGGGEGVPATIDRAFAEFEGAQRPFTVAPQSGYHRLEAGPVILIIDAGAAPPAGFGDRAHAGCLSFEWSSGPDRLVVNVGASLELAPEWRVAGRATNGHSTLVLDDALSAEFEQPRLGRGPARPVGPPHVTAKRTDDEEGAWIEAQHDGYRAAYGLIHRRTIYVDKAGRDIRGLDSLSRPVTQSRASDPWRPPFTIRFHLHPKVQAEVVEKGTAVLAAPNGEKWRLRTDAARMRIEDSVYLGHGDGPQRTRQIVLLGNAEPNGAGDAPPNRVRWAFSRLDG